MNRQKVVGIGTKVYDTIESEKRSKDDLKITQKITREICKTLILGCGCEYDIQPHGLKPTQKHMNCYDDKCKAKKHRK